MCPSWSGVDLSGVAAAIHPAHLGKVHSAFRNPVEPLNEPLLFDRACAMWLCNEVIAVKHQRRPIEANSHLAHND
ncbi:hypothetical protein RSOLAG1IB_00555 [Rhizoctonia solani AG-1 IB]|uniref:Uncharacterized protein n=1 Tax=Thanatephorus cucumeris (strain AG1-IB / isolate 7/3/14) TaxID=1108050 RepID=A0A0B7F738_THACB|nr:hypothetical protein RSOLAG1IB_00555 [Rhizoctonia solani AG-1 IB]